MRLATRQLAAAALGGLIAIALVVVFVSIAVFGVRVDGASMTPTLGEGQLLMLAPFSGGDQPGRFAIVALRLSQHGSVLIKRVIALPGDRVEITRPKLAGNALVLVQPGGHGPWDQVENPAWGGRWGLTPAICCTAAGRTSARADARLVPPGRVFVLGDDPSVSADSRTFGWAQVARITGRLWLRLTPLGRFGAVADPVTLTALHPHGPTGDPGTANAHRVRGVAG